MTRQLTIIGAGISGLTCAIYAQRSGFRTIILEKAGNPGGVSTSWKRKGYNFEGGIHWLIGSREDDPLHEVWTDTGALQDNNPLFFKDPVYTLIYGDKRLELFRDPRKMQETFLAAAPEDRLAIALLRFDLWCFRHFHMPLLDLAGLKVRNPRGFNPMEFVRMLPSVLMAPWLMSFSAGRYARRFRSPILRKLISSVINPEQNALSLVYTMSTFCYGDSGYPEGGSLRMARNMADTFIALGGEIRYNTTVLEVVMDGNKATGVRTASEFIPSDAVVISSDARKAIDRLFSEPLGDKWARQMRRNLETEQCMFIGVGVRADLSAWPRSMQCVLDEPLEVAGLSISILPIHNYSKERDYAPEGCSAVTTLLSGPSYGFWKAAREDGSYRRKKEEIIARFVEILSRFIPETKGKVEVTDMATPLTYERYCDTYDGSYMTLWRPWHLTSVAPIRYKEGLYFTGQRTSLSGGLPIAGGSGRMTAQHLCRDFDMEFVSR